jgi:hypothetical protein
VRFAGRGGGVRVMWRDVTWKGCEWRVLERGWGWEFLYMNLEYVVVSDDEGCERDSGRSAGCYVRVNEETWSFQSTSFVVWRRGTVISGVEKLHSV